MTANAPPPQREDPRATAVLVKDVVAGTQTLVRKELELARLEMMEGLSAYGQAAGMGGAAGVVGLYVLGFLGLAAGYGLGEVLPLWAAFLIVAGVFLLILMGLALTARRKVEQGSLSPVQTKLSIEKDLAWAKRLKKH